MLTNDVVSFELPSPGDLRLNNIPEILCPLSGLRHKTSRIQSDIVGRKTVYRYSVKYKYGKSYKVRKNI